jgi:hypothetical protein
VNHSQVYFMMSQFCLRKKSTSRPPSSLSEYGRLGAFGL